MGIAERARPRQEPQPRPHGAALVLWLAALATGCAEQEIDIRAVSLLDYGGRVERIETLGRYSAIEATLLLQLAAPAAPISIDTDFFLYRVTYPTAAVHGGVTNVSGLIALPVTSRIKGIVGWQHGTKTYRDFSVSRPTEEGIGLAALFAGDGYIVAAADYIGLGVSTEMQAYYHWPSTVSTVVDLLAIAEIILQGVAENPTGDLYLTGFSQGGGATAAVQRQLEQANPTHLKLRGAAAIAGAYDLSRISFPHVMDKGDTFHLGFVAASYAYVYEQSLDAVIREPYRDQLQEWFDGSHDPDFLKQHLPARLLDLCTAEFIDSFAAGELEPHWFQTALDASTTSDYVPEAPLRLYFGNQDTVVVPEESRTAFAWMREQGGAVQLVDVGPYDHDASLLQALPSVQRWFDELEEEQ